MYDTLESLKTRLEALRPLAPEQEQRLEAVLLSRRVYLSNVFEDNSLTLEETEYYLHTQRMVGGKLEREFREIRGLQQAISYLQRALAENRDLSESFIRELHAELTRPIEQDERYFPGEYTPRDVPILGEAGSRIEFTPHDRVPEEMVRLLEWYHQYAAKLHPVELAARFHHRLSLIHPFLDGNGRVARLIDDFVLMRSGYGPALIEDREKYYAAQRAADRSLPREDSAAVPQDTDVSAFMDLLAECSAAGLEVMLAVLEDRWRPPVADLAARIDRFDRIISGETGTEADRRILEEKETTKLALAREFEETIKQKVRSRVVRFLLSGPARFQQNNQQYSPLIAEVTARHQYAFAPSEVLYEYHLAPDLGEIETRGLPLPPFMRLLSFAILSHGVGVGLYSGILDFEFGRLYLKQENRSELRLTLQPASVREMINGSAYQDWDLATLKAFLYYSLDHYFHQIESDYLQAVGNNHPPIE